MLALFREGKMGLRARSILILVLAVAGCDGDVSSDPAEAQKAIASPPAGELYPKFAVGGVSLSDAAIGSGSATDVLSKGTSIYVGGSFRTFASGDSSGRWRIEKRNAGSGSLIRKFMSNVSTDLPLGTVTRLAADQDWLYVAGIEYLGSTDGLPNFAWRVEKRNLVSGKRAPAFGDNGVLFLDYSPNVDICRAIVLQGPNLFLIGEDQIPFDIAGPVRQQWRIEKRSAETGALDPVFGNGGVVTYYQDPGPGNGFFVETRDAVVVGASLFVAGTEGGQWRIEKRDLVTGALDPAFGAAGVVTRDPSLNPDEARRIISDGSFLYVAGFEATLGSGRRWRIEKLNAVTGGLDPSFGTGGSVLPLPEGVNTQPTSIAMVGGDLYVAGIHSSMDQILDLHCIVLKMNVSDGGLSSTFGSGGIVDVNPTSGIDWLNGLATDGSALYLAGVQNDAQWRIEKRAR